MKIALVMAGLPRFFDSHTYNTIKEHFLDKYDCDIYAHFWFNENEDDNYIVSHWIPKNVFPKDTITKFRELYKPVKLEYEHTMTKDESSTNEWYIMKSLYTSKQKAFNLISDVNQYDFIINMRSDSVFLRVPDLSKFDKLKIHAVIQDEVRVAFNDLITIIPAQLASRFYNAVDSFDSLFNKKAIIYGEDVYKAILVHSNLINYVIIYNRSDFTMATHRQGGYLQVCYIDPDWLKITDKLIT
jgi:hypothetical protein